MILGLLGIFICSCVITIIYNNKVAKAMREEEETTYLEGL